MNKNNSILEEVLKKSQSNDLMVIQGVNLINVLIGLYNQTANSNARRVLDPLAAAINLVWRKFLIFYFYWRYRKVVSPGKVIFFANDFTHYNQQSHIYECLIQKEITAQFLTTKYPFVKKLRVLDPSASTVWVNPFKILWYKWVYRKQVLEALDVLASGWMNGNGSFVQVVSKCVKANYAYVLAYKEQYVKLLDRLKPSIVFIGNDLTWEGRLLALCCKSKGIPTANISHGLSELNENLRHTLVDRYFTWGEPERAMMVEKYKLDPEQIVVSGSPFLERKLAHPEIYLYDDNVRSVFDNKGGKRKVLVAFSGPGHITSRRHHELLVNCLHALISKETETHFVIKLHPKDTKNNYERLSTVPNVSVFDRSSALSFEIDKWITYADLVITGSSTSCIDAMVRGVPVMTIDLLDEYSDSLVIRDNVTLHADTCEDFLQNFTKIFDDLAARQHQVQKQNEFVARYFYNGGQPPSERISAAIEKYLR